MLALPVNQMCLFASMDNAPPETRDIKSIKVNRFPGSSILFSSVIQICDSECDQITSVTQSSRMESVCKYLKSVNHLQCTKIVLQVSVYVNAVYRQFYDRTSLSQFSIFQYYYKSVASLCLEERVQQERQKVLCITAKKCSQKSQFWSNFFYLLQLRMLLVNAPAQL